VDLLLTDEQEMLARTARELLDARAPVSAARALRDQGSGHDPTLWATLSELGWPAILVDEAHDGLGLGLAELAAVSEPLGRNLTATPLVSLVIATTLLRHSNHPDLLRGIASGEQVVAAAWHEPFLRNNLDRIKTRAERTDGGWRLSGVKTAISDGLRADVILVAARTDAGLGIFALSDPPVTAERRLDGRDSARLVLDSTFVSDASVVIAPGGGEAALRAALDRGAVALCAEMLGGMQAAFEMTLAYLKTREQFGVPIGSFQVLQHRAARMFIDIELCRSVVLASARVADSAPEELPAVASMAKARCSETFLHVALETVQMHGGIGVTEEHDAGLYLKRARVTAEILGSAAWHRDRWARLRGY
jgi:alkylation response protein AidB-like acyl-CoA dehydrogenase